MNRKLSLVLLGIFSLAILVSAGDFNINYGGSKIFTVATNGTASVINLSVSQLIESTGNISTSAYFVGAGDYLTGISVDDNSTQLHYHNITGIPTCGANEFLDFDGTTLTCEVVSTYNATYAGYAVNGTTISINNVTDVPTCGANTHLTYDGTDLTCTADVIAENTTTISYHNITDIPNCDTGELLKYNSSGMFCVADAIGSVSWTNVSWLNESQTFTEHNAFSEMINATKGVRLMSDTAVITRDGIENVNITIDSSGNINFNLG